MSDQSAAGRLLVLVLLAGLLLPLGGCKKKVDLPNVLLISVDTLRADRLGCYGGATGLTGMMDFWAERGVRFNHAWAPAPWTLPSHASAFTGLYPTEHRAIDDKINIDPKAAMMTEYLQNAGLRTAAFVSHYYLGEEYGFGRGFDHFVIKPDAKADEMVSKASGWIKDNKDESWFVFLHLFDPHTPYQPPVDIAKKHYPSDVDVLVTGVTKDVMDVVHGWPSDLAKRKLRALSALYDGEIEFVDKQLEVLFKSLQEDNLDRNTIIILMSDHGEEFMEHGLMEHGFTLYQEQLAVPFIWYYPAGLPGGLVVDQPASLIDLFPTLMDVLGLEAPTAISGRSLKPLMQPDAAPLDRPLLAETTRQGPDRVTIVRNFKKYMYSPEFRLNGRTFGQMYFDLRQDPGEQNDLFAAQRPAAEKLAGELFATGLYVERRAWHIRWGKSPRDIARRGEIRTTGKFIAQYKNDTVYGTDERGLLVTREFPWDKKDNQKTTFLALPDRDNGFTFITEPETAPITFHLLVDGKEKAASINLGSPKKHPASGHFTLEEPVALEGNPNPPADGFLIWSSPIWVNANQTLRAEVGDPIQLAPEVVEHLRSLGYIQ